MNQLNSLITQGKHLQYQFITLCSYPSYMCTCDFAVFSAAVILVNKEIGEKLLLSIFCLFQKSLFKSEVKGNSQDQPTNQLTNQSTNQPINQVINHSINQSINQSVSQSINQSIHQSINPSINISANHFINKTITQ